MEGTNRTSDTAGHERRTRPRTGARTTVRAMAVRLWLPLAAAAVLVPPAPAGAEVTNPYGLAVIIGNGTYAADVPPVDYAHRDARAFKRYVIDVLGFDPDNVIHIEDATRRQMFDVFGSPSATMSDVQARLSILAPEGGSDVVVYYSGHGVPGKEGGASLLPANIAPYEAETESYPLALLYEKLGALGHTKTVRVFVEACFSGSSDGGRLEGVSPVYQEPAFPQEVTDNMLILTAVTGKQLATWDREAGHGLFTHHLLDALYGRGDTDGDGEVTAREAKAYLDRYMTANAWLRNKRHQNAVLTTRRLAGLALANAGVGGEFPQRPGSDAAGTAAGTPGADEADEARATPPRAVAEVEDEPEAPSPEEMERALGLTHGQRELVQHGLMSLGYEIGRVDGVLGARSRAGISSYQSDKGLRVTGWLTEEVSEALQALGQRHGERVQAAERERLAREKAERERRERERLERERASREPGRRFRDCEETWCPELVVVPAGSYRMGSRSAEVGRSGDEGPVHRVTIARPFAVGVHEVTFEEWDACRRAGGCRHNPGDNGWGRGRRPVINVSWEDAREYVRWLSSETGERYRLLSESEWEYVARAGTTGPFHFGATISTEQANYDGNYTYGSGGRGVYRRKTVSVGSFLANGFGLHDVHGNVWEWVEDCWHGSYRGAPTDGNAWTSGGDCSRRVLRGGSWGSRPQILRSAFRSGYTAGNRYDLAGFRVARTLD